MEACLQIPSFNCCCTNTHAMAISSGFGPLVTVGIFSAIISSALASLVSAQVGDSLPDVSLYENNPYTKVIIREVCATGKHIIFGVPGAFTPGSSNTQLPGFIDQFDNLKSKGVASVSCVAVNDPFVMHGWGIQEGAKGKVRMLADTFGEFTKALGLDLNLTAILGNVRCKRFSMIVNNGKIEVLNVEPDYDGLTCSLVTNLFKDL